MRNMQLFSESLHVSSVDTGIQSTLKKNIQRNVVIILTYSSKVLTLCRKQINKIILISRFFFWFVRSVSEFVVVF